MQAALPPEPVISIVDDDVAIREAMTGLVRAFGFAVEAFDSAEAFLRSDRLRDTSCLVADIQMPQMSGLELLGRLTDQGRRIPTIFITAFPDENVRARASEAGAVGFLSKPFSDDELFTCIRAALNRRP
jgi:FixJ family two-component response regulator